MCAWLLCILTLCDSSLYPFQIRNHLTQGEKANCFILLVVFVRMSLFQPQHGISNNVVHVYATSKTSDQPAPTLSRSLIRAFANHLTIL